MKNLCFALVLLFSFPVHLQYGGGDGSSGNPYQISTPAHFHAVGSTLSVYFIQTANIDLTAETCFARDYYIYTISNGSKNLSKKIEFHKIKYVEVS